MSDLTRRKLLAAGALAGVSAIAALSAFAKRMAIIPPDGGGIWGLGETLSYGAHRVLGKHSRAREFPAAMISRTPFANEVAPLGDVFAAHERNGFADWRLEVRGMVERPLTLSVADVRRFPESRQITEVSCEEGWSYVAEWIGTELSHVLGEARVTPGARYVVYHSIQHDWWDSVDLDEAMHPQTLVTWGMNGGALPVGFGGPLRLRVPRQLGYKSVKYITRLTVTDSMKSFGQGLGSSAPEAGYAWYAGI